MKYYGGKTIYGKEISTILKNIMIKNNIYNYIEPFCGALGVFKHMNMHDNKYIYIGNDISKDLILLWKSVSEKTFVNPKINYKKWNLLKNSNNNSAERAFAGYGCSFGGIFFGSYIDNNDQTYNNIMKYDINFIKFVNKDYINLDKILTKGNFLIYCDPPYVNTDNSPYNRINKNKKEVFNTKQFWSIIKKWISYGNIVVVSEFSIPKNIESVCIWRKKRRNLLNNNFNNKDYFYEKLFKILDI